MIKCVIVDDDLSSLTVLEYFVSRVPDITITGIYSDSVAALSAIRSLNPDLIFLDVEMPGLSGVDITKLMPDKSNIVLITGTSEYAVEGFELGILDFLLKPISFDRFQRAVARFRERLSPLHKTVPMTINEKKKNLAIYVKENYKTVKVFIKNILYIESFKEYVNIITDNRTIRTKQRLSFFEKELSQMSFVRIHKSYLVALDKIVSFSQNQIEIADKYLPVGRIYKDKLKQLNEKNNQSLKFRNLDAV